MDDNNDSTRGGPTDPVDPTSDSSQSPDAAAGAIDPTNETSASAVTGADAPINVTRPRSRLGLYLGGGLALLAVLVVAVVLFVRAQYGDPAEALAAVPDDAVMVMGVDLLALTDEDSIDALVATFEGAFATAAEEGGVDFEDTDDFIDTFEEMFNDETGINLAEDVYPWVGRSFVIAATDEIMATADAEVPEGILMLLSVRDEDAARDFISGPFAEVDEDMTLTETGDSEWTMSDGTPENTVHMRLASGMLMMAPHEEAFDAAAAALDGEGALLDNPAYTDAMDKLPDGRSMYAWIDARSFYESALAADEFSQDDLDELGISEEDLLNALDITVGMAAGLTPDGIVFDFVGATGNDALAGLPGSRPSPLLANVADDTVFFIGASSDTDQSLLDAWNSADESSILGAGADLEASIEQLEDELGTTLITDALSTLTGGFGFAMGPSNTSIPVFGPDFDFGLAIGADIVDQTAADKLVADLVDWAGAGELTIESAGLVDRIVTPDGDELLSVSVTADQIVLGTDVATVGDAATGSASLLVDSDLYRSLDEALPGDGLVLYADVPGMAALFGADMSDPMIPDIDGVGFSYETDENSFGFHGIIHYGDPDDGVGALGR